MRFLLLAIASTVVILWAGCEQQLTRKELGDQSELEEARKLHLNELDSMFAIAYGYFQNAEYADAIKGFDSLQVRDSTYIDYESYGFEAECYKRLGHIEKGIWLYDSLDLSYSEFVKRRAYNFDDSLSLNEIRYMRSIYPEFPPFLRKENGFVPVDTFPRVLSKKEPRYPQNELRALIGGDVYITFRLTGTGSIMYIRVDSATTKGFALASVEALKQWKFTPYKKKGRLSPIELKVPFRFRLVTN